MTSYSLQTALCLVNSVKVKTPAFPSRLGILSPEAQKSLVQIKTYSEINFGRKKAKDYLQNIQYRLELLTKNPLQGLLRKELNSGYYSSFINSHTIYYRIKATHIEVIDVLHQPMEPSKHIDSSL